MDQKSNQIKISLKKPKPLHAPTNDRFTFDDRELKYSENSWAWRENIQNIISV